MGPDGDRSAIAAHDLDLFLEAQLLPLKFAEAEGVRGRSTQFVFDGAFEMLVTDTKFRIRASIAMIEPPCLIDS